MHPLGAEGRRIYLTGKERGALMVVAAKAPREVRTFRGVLQWRYLKR